MFHILLYQPEIPPNTGNILRLCSNTGCKLHLIEPLGFFLDNKKLKRAGLDYIDPTTIRTYNNLQNCLNTIQYKNLYAISTKGDTSYHKPTYQQHDAFLFGPETKGLGQSILNRFQPSHILRIPMTVKSRSLNLANTVAIQVYEAWRQLNFIAS